MSIAAYILLGRVAAHLAQTIAAVCILSEAYRRAPCTIAAACILAGRFAAHLVKSLPRVSCQSVSVHLAQTIASGRVAAHLATIAAACILSGTSAHLALTIAAACPFRACRRASCINNRCRVYPFKACRRAPCTNNRCRVYPSRACCPAHLALTIAAACILPMHKSLCVEAIFFSLFQQVRTYKLDGRLLRLPVNIVTFSHLAIWREGCTIAGFVSNFM